MSMYNHPWSSGEQEIAIFEPFIKNIVTMFFHGAKYDT